MTTVTRLVASSPLILASGNRGKLYEFQRLLVNTGYTIQPQADYQVSSIAETGASFIENALLKAYHCAKHTGHAALADDSGIVVPALSGEPGIYSARYAGITASDHDNVEKLLANMVELPEPQRQAYFYCCLVLCRHATDPTPLIAQGQWHGSITTTPQGEQGFGYDPIFWVPEYQCTAAQLPADQKNQLSHRAIATQQLLAQLQAIQ